MKHRSPYLRIVLEIPLPCVWTLDAQELEVMSERQIALHALAHLGLSVDCFFESVEILKPNQNLKKESL